MSNEDKYILNNSGYRRTPDVVDTPGVSQYSLEEECVSRTVDELEQGKNEYLQKVRHEALRIVEDARKEVNSFKKETETELRKELASLEKRSADLEKARKTLEEDLNELEERRNSLEIENFEKAKADGYNQGLVDGRNEGYKQGIKIANEELEARVSQVAASKVQETSDALLEPLRALIHEMKSARQSLLKNWEENIMQISAAIAYQTILREPTIMKEAPLELLREALELAMNCASLKIRMNPNDVKELSNQIRVVLEETGNIAKSEVVADPKITRGGCLVETTLGIVDERLESRLERIVAELSE